jgi:hypothetical protein
MEWQRHFELHATPQMRRICVFQGYGTRWQRSTWVITGTIDAA